MAGMTEAEIRALLAEYIKAEKAVLKNQSYTIGTRTYTRARLSEIQKGRQECETALSQLTGGGGIKIRRVLFRDD
jgi:ribosomal protein S20